VTTIKLKVVTPERELLNSEVYELIVPSAEGEIAILPGHVPLVSLLMPGIVFSKTEPNTPEDKMTALAISGGVLKVLGDDHVTLLATTAELPQEINLERAQKALERTQKALSELSDLSQSNAAELALQRSMIRIQLAKKYGRAS
jgi:F-type H+-transporting ATPase subunit epsilon